MSDFYNKMYTDVSILKQCSSEIDAEVIVSHKSEVEGEVYTIGGGNSMYSSVDVIPPPKKTLILNPNKDTFVRDDMPTVAFGNAQSMYSGTINGSINSQMFFGFDLTKIPKEIILTKVKLKLYNLTKEYSHNINLYTVNKEWQENNITWMIKPDSDQFITSKDVALGQSEIIIDLMDYVKDCYKGLKTDTGFTIKTNDEKAFGAYTKESQLKPQLLIEYYDPKELVEVNSMDGEVDVYRRDNSELEGEALVRTEYTIDNSEIEGEVTITKPEVEGEVTVLAVNDLEGEVTIYYESVQDIDAEAIVSKPEQLGEIIVAVSNDIDAEVTITKINSDSIDGELTVIKNDKSEVDGEVNIITSKEESSIIEGEVYITKPEIEGETTIAVTNEIEGEVTIYKKEDSTIEGEIFIIRTEENTIDGEVDIIVSKTDNSDIDAEALIQVRDKSLLDGEIDIVLSKEDKSEIDAEVTVIKNDKSELEGDTDIITSKTDNSDLDAEVDILSPNELLGEVNIFHSSDIEGEVTCGVPYVSDMDAEVDIATEATTSDEMLGEVTIYYKEKSTIDAEVDVILSRDEQSEMECEMSVIIPYVSDMDAEVIVKTSETDKSDIDAEIDIEASYTGYMVII